METHARSILKAITFRLIATLITILLVFAFTADLALSVGVGSLEFMSKLIVYYFHERIWNALRYGRKGE